MVKQVALGAKGPKGDSAFLWIYSHKPGEHIKVFAQLRKDGKIGAPGGKVEGNETLLQAVIREVKEETGIDLSRHEEYLEELATFGGDEGKHSHSFGLKVDEDLLYKFQEMATVNRGTHGKDEAFGYVLLPVTNYKNYQNILKHNFAFSARAEFSLLVQMVSGLMSLKDLKKK